MFRAFSTRSSRSRSYEKLGDEPASVPSKDMFQRSRSVPAGALGSPVRSVVDKILPANSKGKPPKKANTKSHPLFSLFVGRRSKKTTARPEFARYLEYVKEGGSWDVNTNVPVIYYK